VIGVETIIQILTCSALVGLLGAVGLRLTWEEVAASLRRSRVTAILLINFLGIPALAVLVASWFELDRQVTVAVILLAAAPFAPVVPVFARMARADLPLAAGLTGVVPLLSAILTPITAQLALRSLANTQDLQFHMLSSLAMLTATITLPLFAGGWIRHRAPLLGHRLLRPVEIISEVAGAASLTFVTVSEFGSITRLGWRAWVAMALIFECALLLGWYVGGPTRGTRQVVALGTSNRNIALALLVALSSFPGTDVPAAVVGNGLLLIAFGLLHVAWWRFGPIRAATG
jgi:BASS family bile acid:Na+ symporter